MKAYGHLTPVELLLVLVGTTLYRVTEKGGSRSHGANEYLILDVVIL